MDGLGWWKEGTRVQTRKPIRRPKDNAVTHTKNHCNFDQASSDEDGKKLVDSRYIVEAHLT